MSLNTARALERLLFTNRTLTHDEFKKIEEIVFSGDGLVEREEFNVLAQATVATDRFENFTDRVLIELLASKDITLERYLGHLKSLGLAPAHSPEELEQITHEAFPSSLAVIQKITQTKDGSFEISVCMQGTLTQISYVPGSPLSTLTQFPKISWLEMFVAVENYRCRIKGDQKMLVDNLAESLNKQNKEDQTFYQVIYGRHGFDSANLNQWDLFSTVQSYPGIPLTGITDDGEKNIFIAKDQLPVNREALQNGWRSLPPRLRDWLGQTGYTIHLADFDQVNRDFYNQYSESDYTQTGRPAGFTAWFADPPATILDSQLDPQATSHALVHEIGHMVHALLDKKTGAWQSDQKGYAPGEVGQILRHHHNNLWSLGKLRGALTQTTMYGATSYVEWFPEMFAIYNLAKRGRDLCRGEFSVQESGMSFAERLNDFRTKDPVGYLLIAKLDQYFREGRANPEEALSWTMYQAAQDFSTAHNGMIDATAETAWEKLSPDFNLERKWKEAGKDMVKKARAYGTRPDAGNFFLIRRDCLKNDYDRLKTAPQEYKALEDFGTEMLKFISQYPLDALSLHFLSWGVESDQGRRLVFGDPAMGPVFRDVLNQMIAAYPAEPHLIAIQGRMAMIDTDYTKAAGYFQRAIALSPMSSLADQAMVTLGGGIRHLYAKCLHELGNDEAAEKYYSDAASMGNNVSVDVASMYIKAGNDEKLIQVVLDIESSDYKSLALIAGLVEPVLLKRLQAHALWKDVQKQVKEIIADPKSKPIIRQYPTNRQQVKKIFGV